MPSSVRPLEGPSTLRAGSYDLGALEYAEQEFVVEGSADSYRFAGERGADGHWEVEPSAAAPFVTRVVVRRPSDPARCSGTVAVEWLNVSAGFDTAPDWSLLHRHLVRRGHAWVGVSAQKVGIEGGGIVEGMHLKKALPERYGALSHPGDAWSFDMFTQVARWLRDGGDREEAGLLGGLAPERLLAVGESQSAFCLVTYINAIDRHAACFDGFFVHGRGATGADLEEMPPVASEDLEEVMARTLSQPGEQIRDDLRVPVLVVQSETDVSLLRGGMAQQPDGERLRQWEIAGSAHADTYTLIAGEEDDGSLSVEHLADRLRPTREIPVIGLTTGTPINAGPQQHYVGQAAFEHLDRWAAGGAPPPTVDRLAVHADLGEFDRDEHGIATGGLRTPWVDVPTATMSGLGQTGEVFAILFGTTIPFDAQTLARLYPGGRDDYLAQFTAALDRTIGDGFLLDDDRTEILGVAAASYPAV
jgi:hypothetical protein